MKIAFIGNFESGWRTEYWVAQSLKELGVKIRVLNERNINKDKVVDILASDRPDALLWSKGRVPGGIEGILNYCRSINLTTICWLFDLYWGTPREYDLKYRELFQSDIVCTTDGGHKDKWMEWNVNHHVLRQGIYQHECHFGDKINAEPVIFVGSHNHWYPHRTKMIRFLEKEYGSDFRMYGGNNPVRGRYLNNLVTSAKVVVCDSVYSPYYWSNRIYEVMGRGGVVLHSDIPGLSKEFEYDKHLKVFHPSDFKQLKNQIDYLLTHDKEREKIRKQGHGLVRRKYTYLHRCQHLLQILYDYREQNTTARGGDEPHAKLNLHGGGSGKVSPAPKVCQQGGASTDPKRSGGTPRANTRKKGMGQVSLRASGKSGGGTRSRAKVTAILLNYQRPENYPRLVENLHNQKDVDVDIWIWDSGHNLDKSITSIRSAISSASGGVKIFSDHVNPGIFIRWELARFAKTRHVLFIDDDVLPLDDTVLIDTIDAQKGYGNDVVVGWKGVKIVRDEHNNSQHVHSEKITKDYGVHFCKGNYMLFDRKNLHTLMPFPPEILDIDPKAHGEFWYQLQMQKTEPRHRVLACLNGRLTNEYTNKVGLEFRKDHYENQHKHLKLCLKKLRDKYKS